MKTILFALIMGSFILLSVGFIDDKKSKERVQHSEEWDATSIEVDIWHEGVTDEIELRMINFRKQYPISKFHTRIDSVYRLIYAFRKGALFPQICLKDSVGKEYCIADFKGKIVYLDIWGTFCSPCVKNLREMERLVLPKLKDRDKIVFVSLDLEKTVTYGLMF